MPFSVFFGIDMVLNLVALLAFNWVLRTLRGPVSIRGVKLGLAVGLIGGTLLLDMFVSIGLFVQALRCPLPFYSQ